MRDHGRPVHGLHTFSKRERLQYGHQFRRVRDHGRRVGGAWATVWVLEEPSPSGGCAIGIVTSRHIGGAVVRNRVRRLLRDAYRWNKQKLKPNLQIVVVARPAIAGQRTAEVASELLRLLQAAGAMVKP